MRRLLIALAVALIPSLAIAHGHGGGGGGHMGGGWAGGHSAAFAGGARMGAWSGHMAAWNGGRMAAWAGRPGNWNRFHHGHFVHHHGRVLAGLGGVVTATTIVVAGNGSRPDGVRNGSGSAAATIRYDFCQKLLMPAERDQLASARSFRLRLMRSSRLSLFGRQEGVLLSCL